MLLTLTTTLEPATDLGYPNAECGYWQHDR
jgi:hypothetical protein